MMEAFFTHARNEIDEYCRRYSVRIEIERYDLTAENWKSTTIPFCEDAGCYLFYSEAGVLLYVGKTNGFGRRISSYFQSKPEFAPKAGHVWAAPPRYALVIKVEERWEASSLEEYLIVRLRPCDNTRGIECP